MLRRRKFYKKVYNNFRVSLFDNKDFNGRSLRFRGPLAIRNLSKINFNDVISSFQFDVSDSETTLVLFSGRNYQGDFVAVRGDKSRQDLSRQGFDNRASSLIAIDRRLSNNDIRQIQNNRRVPGNITEIL